MANKADVIPEPEDKDEPEPKTAGKKVLSGRRRRALFDPEEDNEPFLGTPGKVSEAVACKATVEED